MSDNIIIALIVFGFLIIIGVIAINQIVDFMNDNPPTAWFILGFGACLLFEGILMGANSLYKRYFP